MLDRPIIVKRNLLETLAFGKENPRRLTELAFESNGATSVAS